MNSPCSIELLESALTGTLPAADEASLQRHLESCEECGAALERMAGGPAWCQEAAALLTQDELDVAVPTRDEWSAVDFTVEHLEPSDEPNVLGRLGGYDVLDVIGHGGMGVVLKAFDRELKRCVAIKVLAPHLAQSSLAKKRFAREAQAAAAVVHPNVLAIHQVQPSGRLPFLVMPLVAGESLAQRLTAQGTLDIKEILRIGMQAAAGLSAAHEQGLVHRDVKPANILLEKGVERAVLTDFGLARAADDVTLTRWGIIAGTPQYMSPEQARGESLDGRSDLFSLGCVLYEMGTGVSPFRTESIMATMRRLVDDSPQAMGSLNPELPPWFIAIVGRLLEKEPSKRFTSAKEVSELLESCLAHLQQPASVPLPTGIPPYAVPQARRSRMFRWAGVLIGLLALGIGVWAVLLAASDSPDIAGEWSGGDEWGKVVLKATNSGEYTGSYSETVGKQTGEIQLKWSRIERRFNGTWREGENRFGELSVRLVGGEIRGALTTDAKSKVNPATPLLADLTWTKSNRAGQAASFGPVIEKTVNDDRTKKDWMIDLDTGVLHTPPVVADSPRKPEEMMQWARTNGIDASGIKASQGILLGVELQTVVLENASWETVTPELLKLALKGQPSAAAGPNDNGQPGAILSDQGGQPATLYGFQTREGGFGVLQVVGISQNPSGVKIRYKLVNNANSAQGTQSVAAAVNKAVKTISTCGEGDPRVAEAMASLKGLNEGEVLAEVAKFFDAQEATVRRAAIFVLWQGKFASNKPVVPGLLRLCDHPEDLTRGMAALTLGENGVAESFGVLMKMTADDKSGYARRCAAYALGQLGDPAATGVLEKALKDPEELVRGNARAALAMLKQKGAAWSKPNADGLQIRATVAKDRFSAEESPVVKLDLRNSGTKPVDYIPKPHVQCRIDLDGKWFRGGPLSDIPLAQRLNPGEERLAALAIPLTGIWVEENDPTKSLKLAPGTHEVRIAFHPEGVAETISNPIKIEIERGLSEKTRKVMDSLLADLDGVRIIFENRPQEQAGRHNLILSAKQGINSEFYLSPPMTKEQLKKVLQTLADNGFFDRAKGDFYPPKTSLMPPATKKEPGYILIVLGSEQHGDVSWGGSFEEDLSQREGAALATAKAIRAALDGEAADAADTICREIEPQTFGPEIEYVLFDLRVDRKACAFNLEELVTVPMPGSITLKSEPAAAKQPEALAWARKEHVDLVAFLTGEADDKIAQRGVYGFDLLAIPVKNDAWDKLTAAQAAQRVRQRLSEHGDLPEVTELTANPKSPETYLIQTRSIKGDPSTPRIGLLQILNIFENSRVRIRYKLVQTSAKAPPQSEPIRALKQTNRFNSVNRVGTLACSPNGRLVAVANDGPTLILLGEGHSKVADNWQPAVEILDSTIGKSIATLKLTSPEEDALLAKTGRAPGFEVKALAFSPDSAILAVGTSLGQVKLFYANTGKFWQELDDLQGQPKQDDPAALIGTFVRALGSVGSLAFSPDGNLLVVGGGSLADVPLLQDAEERVSRFGESTTGPGRLKLWDVKTGKLKRDLVGHADQVNAVAFSPDGKLLASAGRWLDGKERGQGVKVWDSASGELKRKIEVLDNGGARSIAFSPDGNLLAIGTQRFDKDKDTRSGGVSLTHVSSGILEWSQTVSEWANPVCFTRDGEQVVALCGGHAINLFDTKTGKLKYDIHAEHERWNTLCTGQFLHMMPAGGGGDCGTQCAISEDVLMIGGVAAEKRGFVSVWNWSDGAAVERETSAALFGAVVERVLELPEPNSLSPVWLDLDQDIGIAIQEFTGDKDEPGVFAAWLRKQGADLCAANFDVPREDKLLGIMQVPDQPATKFVERGLGTIVGLKLRSMPIKKELWESADVNKIVAWVNSFAAQADSDNTRKLVPAAQSPTDPTGRLPATFVFETAEEHVGLLQITGFSDQPRGVKIRYKVAKWEPADDSVPGQQLRRVLLAHAKAELTRLEVAFKAGAIEPLEFQMAKDKVEVLEAELNGDPVRVAEVKLTSARRKLDIVSNLVKEGKLTAVDLAKANYEVARADAEVQLIKATIHPGKDGSLAKDNKPDETALPKRLEIRIHADGRYSVKGNVVTPDELEAQLKKRLADNPALIPIVLQPDAETPYQHCISVFEMCGKYGEQVALQIAPAAQENSEVKSDQAEKLFEQLRRKIERGWPQR